jgi:hypothetical protein
VRGDFEKLQEVVGDLRPAFSWHRPAPRLLEGADVEVPGLVNVYGKRFFREMPYLSDSTFRHDGSELEAVLLGNTGPELQLLLHPVNWIAGGSSGVELLVRGWAYVLRDHEKTLMENRTYVDCFPDGMPANLIDDFERALLRAASVG